MSRNDHARSALTGASGTIALTKLGFFYKSSKPEYLTKIISIIRTTWGDLYGKGVGYPISKMHRGTWLFINHLYLGTPIIEI